jgi:predicted metal-dependent enzyme (double-stranded beta helix superfamily)
MPDNTPADTPDTTVDDEWVVDHPTLRRAIASVNEERRRAADPAAIVRAIRPHVAALLAASDWLPAQYQAPAPAGGMGSGIGTWLLYRAGDGGLTLSALVVPPGAQTPVHDHLAWGLVGLYRGQQEETVYVRRDRGERAGYADLALAEQRSLRPGALYEILPETDIHCVRTTSAEPSVSLHLLGSDIGCTWRHRFAPEDQRVEPFRSGYVNRACAHGD